MSETVWSGIRLYDKGIYTATRYYRKNGDEVFMDGSPIAASPAGVPDQALFYPSQSVWCLGRVRQRENDEMRIRRYTDEGNGTYEARWNSKGQLMEQRDTEWANDEIVYRKELGKESGKLAEGVLSYGVLTGIWKVYGEDGNVRHSFEPASLKLEVDLKFSQLWYDIKKAAFVVYARALPPLSQSEELSKVDWSDVEGPYGDTLHQGSVYFSTVKVIPLLVGVLAHPMADKSAILNYLFTVGSSAAHYEEDALAELKDSDGEGEAGWTEPILGTLRCLSDGMPEIQKLMELEESDIKEKVILLSQFSSGHSVVAENLMGIANDSGASLALRAIALYSLSILKVVESGYLEPSYNDLPFVEDHLRANLALAAGGTSLCG